MDLSDLTVPGIIRADQRRGDGTLVVLRVTEIRT